MVYIVDLNEKPFHPVSLLLALVAEQKRGLNSVPAANLNTSTGEHFDTEDLITDHNRLTLSPKKVFDSTGKDHSSLFAILFLSGKNLHPLLATRPRRIKNLQRIPTGMLRFDEHVLSSGNGKLWHVKLVPCFILRSN
ncbi:hypothetical protein CEXT_721141 [Caerostris extrusa]|uniref:Uncharacterized protein n=1 Tax=Caerostris extrusa TaxID=172846 RepID=A0AAV4TE12_CAEEX|nr:hypothetical protein CEXT_721141 [Caerostris extrusa]